MLASDDFTDADLTFGVRWVMAHPDPLTAAVPFALREKWLAAGEAALPRPLDTEIFMLYCIGRVKSELIHEPLGTKVRIYDLDGEDIEIPDVSLGAVDQSMPPKMISAYKFAEDFDLWVIKLALSIISDRTDMQVQGGPLFRFPAGESIGLRQSWLNKNKWPP